MAKFNPVTNQAKVGIFSTIVIIIFVLGFYFLKGINLFENTKDYYAVYERVDGLNKSNIVEYNGFPVGRVSEMKRNTETGKIIVKFALDKTLRIPKSDSTIASLVSTDFFGSKKVNLVFGNSKEYYKEGDTISTSFKQDLTEQIGNQIDPIMINIQRMMPQLDSTIRGIKMMFDAGNPQSFHTSLAEINQILKQIDTILAQNSQTLRLTISNLQSITANVEKSNETITKILNNAGDFTDSLKQANIKQTIENLNTAITQLNEIVKDINEGNGTLGKVIKEDELYAKVDSAVMNLNVLLRDVKERPYRYISINVLGSKKAEERRAVKYNESGMK